MPIIVKLLSCLAIVIISQITYAAKPVICPPLTGTIITPNHPAYQGARLVANYYASKNARPNVIVYCRNHEDVQHAIAYARCKKLPIRVRSGGHNHEGYSTGNNVVLIDVSKMKDIYLDKKTKIITVQPGMTGGELYKKLYTSGLTQVGSTSANVGISGLILTGGIGPMLRKHGLACDNLRALEMVDANGQLLQITKDNEYKDLFWASCGGGGGNFGVVTSLTLQVYPAPRVTWFNLGWEWDQPIDQVITTWQSLFASNDPRWFSHLDLWSKAFSSEEYKKSPVKVLGVYFGTVEEATRALAPLLSIGHQANRTIKAMRWNEAVDHFGDATAVYLTGQPQYKSSGAYVMQPLPEAAIKIMTDTLQKSSSPLLNITLFSMNSADTVAPTDTAYFYRRAPFFMVYSDQWLKDGNDKKQMAALNKLRASLEPYTVGDYVGNPDREIKNYMTAYYGDNAKRLRCIKRKYDPTNVFSFPQAIPPAPKDWDCAS